MNGFLVGKRPVHLWAGGSRAHQRPSSVPLQALGSDEGGLRAAGGEGIKAGVPALVAAWVRGRGGGAAQAETGSELNTGWVRRRTGASTGREWDLPGSPRLCARG